MGFSTASLDFNRNDSAYLMIFRNSKLDYIGLEVHKPHEKLSPYIQCYWSAKTEVDLIEPIKNKIISDGGSGVVFNYESPLTLDTGENQQKKISGCFFTSPTINTTYLTFEGKIHIIGIRFKPSGAYPFIQEYRVKSQGAIKFQPINDDNSWNDLMAHLEEFPLSDIATQINNFLLNKLSVSKLDLTKWLLSAINLLVKHNGNLQINELCKNMNISRRQFDRNFKKCVGILPKQLSRIVRINNSRALIRSFEYDSLAEIAHECGFFDQSHFVSEFKALVDITPKKYSDQKKRDVPFLQ